MGWWGVGGSLRDLSKNIIHYVIKVLDKTSDDYYSRLSNKTSSLFF